MALVSKGKYHEAAELIRKDNVLPGICGRICTHPCEDACRRGDLDEALAIKDIKRFVADYERSHPGEHPAQNLPVRREKIAVVGSGPAGLAAAADLARLGYGVTVFEKEKEAGGLLRYGLGPYRLPRDILDFELKSLEGIGVRFKTGTPVDFAGGLEDLRKEFDAVILASGSWSDRKLGVPGEDLEGVEACIDFLSRLYRGEVEGFNGHAAVIGDGNGAFDLARALVRIGARVSILSWFPESLIPADHAEIVAAKEEGIEILENTQVIEFSGSGGRLEKLRCIATQPGPPDANFIPWPIPVPDRLPFEMKFDRAFVAVGQVANPALFEAVRGIETVRGGYVHVDQCCCTGLPNVYAAGDIASGPSTVVKAMASGRKSARAVHLALSGENTEDHLLARPQDRDFSPISPDTPFLARAGMPERQPSVRTGNFSEVALGLDEAQARAESARCLQCGGCSECLQCAAVCPADGAMRHDDISQIIVEHAGVVIIADPSLAPRIKGEDVLRAYSSKSPKTDAHAMMLRGFAAAAEAMVLLGGTSQRMRGHGLSFSPPALQLAPEVRIGVFVCSCNESLGWRPEMTEYVGDLLSRNQVAHAEILSSACSPEGSASILKTIRQRGLTRVVLASCVCCPLDFICSACTDQRSRLKNALFHGTGVNRAMVETCNLRGEVLRLLSEDPLLALDRFTGLIDRCIGRTAHLKALPSPARPYNFTTAVIGQSEAASKSAQILAEAGMEVFLFGTPDEPLSEIPNHPNIHSFKDSTVKNIRGTVGNFQIIIEPWNDQQVFHVGAVIIGEQSRRRIKYMPMADLPPHLVEASMQRRGVPAVPLLYPGATSVPGLFLANPPGINVSERVKGAAAAIMAASVMPRSPRQNKGYTVVVDESRCRGCGRCIQICPFNAVSFRRNELGGWCSVVDEALCKGCGNCIPVCPSNAADSPYRDRRYLEQMIEEILL
jgi:NADPH-dependent glutamate synthase beta subunit-like oxidoreductase/Pyruvate/2-oxoacid:ferredoxin oxidoreductase delta subunit